MAIWLEYSSLILLIIINGYCNTCTIRNPDSQYIQILKPMFLGNIVASVLKYKFKFMKFMGWWTHTQTGSHTAGHILTARTNLTGHFQSGQSTPLLSAGSALLRSQAPCQVFQARSQRRGSAGLEACSLVKYLNYVIDVSTVIKLAAAHPSGWPMPTQLHGALWRSCQTGLDEVCVNLFVCISWNLLFW